jgi:hypothetical protein
VPGGGTAAVFVAGLLDRLGVTDAVRRKAVPFNTGREVIAAVLMGDAETRHRLHHRVRSGRSLPTSRNQFSARGSEEPRFGEI